MKPFKKLNSNGIAHYVLFAVIIIGVAVVGTYFLVASHALTSYKVSATGDESDISLVNKERSSRKVATLTRGSILDGCALGWAKHMASTQTLAHNPNLSKCVTSDSKSVGENVGYGPSVSVIHTAFMNSPPHKANILDKDYNRIGVGVAIDAKGRYWVCEVFRDPR